MDSIFLPVVYTKVERIVSVHWVDIAEGDSSVVRGGYEHRGFTRVPIQGELTVKLAGESGTVVEGILVNLSISGAHVECTKQLGADEVCTVSILLDEDASLEMRATVTRVEPDSMGVEFTGISGKSYKTLHEILVDNAEDPGTIRNEMFERSHFEPEIY